MIHKLKAYFGNLFYKCKKKYFNPIKFKSIFGGVPLIFSPILELPFGKPAQP